MCADSKKKFSVHNPKQGMSLALFHEYRNSEQGVNFCLSGYFTNSEKLEFAIFRNRTVDILQTRTDGSDTMRYATT